MSSTSDSSTTELIRIERVVFQITYGLKFIKRESQQWSIQNFMVNEKSFCLSIHLLFKIAHFHVLNAQKSTFVNLTLVAYHN